MGLAFSVPNSCKCPPSLINIFKEIENEFGTPCEKLGDLTYLTKQGVFLINTILTVEEGKPMSHKIKEYSCFIQDLLGFLDNLDYKSNKNKLLSENIYINKNNNTDNKIIVII